MIHCIEAAQLIYDKIDGILDPNGEKRLQDHLKSCLKCARAYEEALSLHGIYSTQSVLEPPKGLQERIMAHISALEPAAAPHRRSVYWERMVASAQCAAAFLLLYFSTPYLSEFKSLLSQLPFPRQIWQIDLSFVKSISLPELSLFISSLAGRVTQVMAEFSQGFAVAWHPNLLFILAGLILLQVIGNRLLFSSLRT